MENIEGTWMTNPFNNIHVLFVCNENKIMELQEVKTNILNKTLSLIIIKKWGPFTDFDMTF